MLRTNILWGIDKLPLHKIRWHILILAFDKSEVLLWVSMVGGHVFDPLIGGIVVIS